MQSNASMTAFVVDLLKRNIPSFYYYHNFAHTLYVADKAIEIGKAEGCTEREIMLVNAAALWHDTGYIGTYAGHEEESARLAAQYLPSYGYSIGEIGKIHGMIMATSVPQSPKNKLEEIVADADLEYLGTSEAAHQADLFYKELNHLDPSLTKEQWDRKQIAFLQSHHYFTAYCKRHKESAKSDYLKSLLAKVE